MTFKPANDWVDAEYSEERDPDAPSSRPRAREHAAYQLRKPPHRQRPLASR